MTIVAATALHIDQHAIAIDRTANAIPFPVKRLLLSPDKPAVPFSGEWSGIPAWTPDGRFDWTDYNKFIICGLHDFIDTEYCITVHWDGYGVNPDRWTDEFLDYDYIGAPWPPHLLKVPDHSRRVGNGGFSLRSKRWLRVGKEIASSFAGGAEDVFCCQTSIGEYLKRGCHVAPIDVAMRFSIELHIPEYPDWSTDQSFGFHGWFSADRDKYRIT